VADKTAADVELLLVESCRPVEKKAFRASVDVRALL
jgi:hypothetical protein